MAALSAEPLLCGQQWVAGLLRTYTATFTGQGFADFLLDQTNAKGIGGTPADTNQGIWGHRQNRIGLFFQDDFKVKQNFTLNLGMRWEYTSPVVEVKDRQANFELYSGKLLFAGQRRQ